MLIYCQLSTIDPRFESRRHVPMKWQYLNRSGRQKGNYRGLQTSKAIKLKFSGMVVEGFAFLLPDWFFLFKNIDEYDNLFARCKI